MTMMADTRKTDLTLAEENAVHGRVWVLLDEAFMKNDWRWGDDLHALVNGRVMDMTDSGELTTSAPLENEQVARLVRDAFWTACQELEVLPNTLAGQRERWYLNRLQRQRRRKRRASR